MGDEILFTLFGIVFGAFNGIAEGVITARDTGRQGST